jgi:pyridoxal phosphate enzyme (YggS family)
MVTRKDNYFQIKNWLTERGVLLVAVSKTKPVAAIMELYEWGQRDFGENYVQELTEKYRQLPKDIRWHFIGHLQTNKVKLIAPFIHLIHGVDHEKLLLEIDKQGLKNNRIIPCLLQMYIASEETKFGLESSETEQLFKKYYGHLQNVSICGLMGMASFTNKQTILEEEFGVLQKEFLSLQALYAHCKQLSCGMSADYETAIKYGSTMVRIGSLLFGKRTEKKTIP